MSTQKNLKNWELKNNSLKERIKFLMTPEELEKPYSFATRIGLPKTTFTGIWIKGRESLHKATMIKICEATGANPAWLMTGLGEPFNTESSIPLLGKNFSKSRGDLLITSAIYGGINKKYLEQCFESTDGALKSTFRMMQADDKAEFILKFYMALLEEEGVTCIIDPELFVLAVFTIEIALYYARQTMSPKNKAELIVDIYDKYHIDTDLTQNIKSDFDEYKRNKA